MGNFNVKEEIIVLMMGFSCSGKTHFISKIKGNSSGSIPGIPTDGWNQEKYTHKGINLNFFDIGSKRSEIWPKIVGKVGIGCLYYFIDANDDLGQLFLARNNLLGILKSDMMINIPVVIIHNVNLSLRNRKITNKRRPFENLCDGLKVNNLTTWLKSGLYVTDLSYTEINSMQALLNWTIKKGIISHPKK